jgi:2-polyprenyl-3-methyl-5-hydroxy-6-metoxy-1,4-benzoquinol methylase
LSKSEESLSGNFDRYRRDWEANARIDSMWSVLSLPEKMGGGWKEGDFYKLGEQEIGEIFRFMGVHAIGLSATDKVLDFGSGLGRLTEALARRFNNAVGIDISKSMVKSAADRAVALKLPNIEYVLSTSADLSVLGAGSFDFVYSNITLQHLNTDLQKTYIREFAQLLRPGGVVAFQIPSRSPNLRWRGLASIRRMKLSNLGPLIVRLLAHGVLPWRIKMEFNTMAEADVRALAQGVGLAPAGIGYIDWDALYQDQVFRLCDDPHDRSSYPVSPIYFFRSVIRE